MRTIATALILVLGTLHSSALAEEIPWSEPDAEACARARAEMWDYVNITSSRIDQSLADDPLCQLSDLTIKEHFSQIGPGPRVGECSHHTSPPSSTIEYSPTVIAPHEVDTSVVKCTHDIDGRKSTCQFESIRAHFADDPKAYFSVAAGVPLAQAIRVARLFHSGSLHHRIFSPDSDPMRRLLQYRLIEITAEQDAYALKLATCGCSSTPQVRISVEVGHEQLEIQGESLQFSCS